MSKDKTVPDALSQTCRMNNSFAKMHQTLSEAQSVAITMHVRPDGDSLGSSAALRMMLLSMGKRVDVFFDGEVPNNLLYIEGVETFIPAGTDFDDSTIYDVLIVLDTNEAARIGAWQTLLDRAKRVIVFDHHLNPTLDAYLLITNPLRASVGEMMFEYMTDQKVEITTPMAEALYTAVSSDTGCFLFPNTTSYTHHVASELMKTNINVATINYSNFREYDPKQISALMEVLRQIKFLAAGKIAVTYLNYKMVKKYKFDHETRHRFQRYATDAQGVRVSIFLTEMERDVFNISLRSHGNVNVAEIAATFGGGGHKNAAGVTMEGRYKNVIKKLVERVELELRRCSTVGEE
ncbi:MAG: bifunctional oligoribonuclease/PAP phosphatase NrnA [Firmicutes bacterium]|nr:bifunctional oligoribonuclease/PAP phosphatase NrnA [Bacillota bacterium]